MTEAQALTAALRRIEAQLAHSSKTQADIIARLTTVEALSKRTIGVVEAWDAMKTGGAFLKWLGGVVAALGVLMVAAKAGIHWWGK